VAEAEGRLFWAGLIELPVVVLVLVVFVAWHLDEVLVFI
jgi:hypothetical protein